MSDTTNEPYKSCGMICRMLNEARIDSEKDSIWDKHMTALNESYTISVLDVNGVKWVPISVVNNKVPTMNSSPSRALTKLNTEIVKYVVAN